MRKKYVLLQKSTSISPYIWSAVSILPFYFIFPSSSKMEIMLGIILTVFFFITYRFSFISTKWPVYLWSSILITISITMTLLFNYVYFAFYIAYYNGKVKNRIAFFTLYFVHLVCTTIMINYKIILQGDVFLKQLPFVIIVWISIILLPFNIYNREIQEKLEAQLKDANKRIAELVKQEERQRIARDLHDTLGQKLSLIGLKSDLARKLIDKEPARARSELKDVQQTARTALNEVRKIVSHMRGIRLDEEMIRIKQLLQAAEIELILKQQVTLQHVSLFLENILSMCLKEAVTNVVKHSQGSICQITISQSESGITILVSDNGIGMKNRKNQTKGNGLQGIKERLEFVNGSMEILNEDGTTLMMSVPHDVLIHRKGEA